MDWLTDEIRNKQYQYQGPGNIFAARLNGTSDIKWESVECQGFSNIFEVFPDVTFYDYTKIPGRKIDHIKNYSLTFSFTGRNILDALQVLENQGNVAIVFNTLKNSELPISWKGYTVIDGDVTDYRPGDCKGCVVGLRFKHTDNETVNKAAIISPFIVDPKSPDCQHVNGPALPF